jgi:phosphoadenosine phosphosulfate reductase
MTPEQVVQQYGHLDGRQVIDVLARQVFPGRIAVTSSFGAESAVLLDLVAQVDPALPVLFIDTGELFDETVAYRDQLIAHLGLTNVQIIGPTPQQRKQADELWQTDPDGCCSIRKVQPLALAVQSYGALIDGRKKAHGFERDSLPTLQVSGHVVKVSPLAHWDEAQIERAFVDRALPRHPLVAQGYRSIGCWPCTRPIQPGESPRAGRWAGAAKTECGIHTVNFSASGKIS